MEELKIKNDRLIYNSKEYLLSNKYLFKNFDTKDIKIKLKMNPLNDKGDLQIKKIVSLLIAGNFIKEVN